MIQSFGLFTVHLLKCHHRKKEEEEIKKKNRRYKINKTGNTNMNTIIAKQALHTGGGKVLELK